MTSVDRRKWIAERTRFLEEALQGDVTDEQRAAIQSELEQLRQERGPWWRRFTGLPR